MFRWRARPRQGGRGPSNPLFSPLSAWSESRGRSNSDAETGVENSRGRFLLLACFLRNVASNCKFLNRPFLFS